MTSTSDASTSTAREGGAASPSQKARSSILRASAIMASGTMVSRILGFIRSAMLLAAIGAAGGGVSAAFQTANTLPNTVFNLLASGIFDAVLVPQIVGALKRKHDGETYVNRLLTLAGILLFVVTVVSMIAAPLLVVITAAGYDSQIRNLAILFAFLCLPQLFFYGLYNLLGELLNARGVFGPYMWAPVVNNVVGIAGLAAFLAIWGGTDGRLDVSDFSSAQFWVLGGSATLGVIAQALCLLIPMRRANVHFKPDFHFRGTHFGSTSKVAGWTFATLGVSQVGVLSTNNLAALADAYAKSHDGVVIAGINAYATAFMIFMVPQSLITVSLTTAIFTRMAEAVSDGDDRGVAANYTLGVRTITSLTLLAAAILIAGAMPMMQMALPSYADQRIVASYAWVLAALMPGVASTGMVLMSQRVFFAYEDAKPVFLMGIGPTIVQVIVGWSMYFLTGSQWWVVGAALAETACRLVQGVIAVVWVSRRNAFVSKPELLRSYFTFSAAAVFAGVVSFAVLWFIGVRTISDSSAVRFVMATAKMMLVSVVASLVYMVMLRLISPRESATTIAPLLVRLRVPLALRSVLAAPLRADGTDVGDNDCGHSSDSEGQMAEDYESPNGDSTVPEEPTKDLGAVFRSDAFAQEHASTGADLPTFDDIIEDDDEVEDDTELVADDGASSGSSEDDSSTGPAAWAAAAGSAAAGWTVRARDGFKGLAQRLSSGTRGSEGIDDDRGADVDDGASDPFEPNAVDGRNLDDAALGGAAAPALPPLPPTPSSDLDGPDLVDFPPAPPALEDQPVDFPPSPPTGIPMVAAPSTPTDTATWTREDAARASGHRLIDPTKPTLIFAAALTVFAGIWGVTTALAPVSTIDVAQSLADAQSAMSQSGDGTQSAHSDQSDALVAPKITAVTVLSWSDDGGDHPDTAVNMIDANPETSWHSRYFEQNQFLDESVVTILVKLEQSATVSGVTLQMDPSTSGGEVVVRNVTDTANPRAGTELVSSALSPSTDIALPQPVETNAIALTFRVMPTSVDGNAWAWVNELTVR